MDRFAAPVCLVMLSWLGVTFFLGGCANEQSRHGGARAVEANRSTPIEIQRIAAAMTRSLLQVSAIATKSVPVVVVREVRNETSEGIDTRAITDTILGELYRSTKVRLVADTSAAQKGLEKIVRDQDTVSDKEQTTGIEGMPAPQYQIEGIVAWMVKNDKDIKRVHFIFCLQLRNVGSGVVEWTDQKEIARPPTEEEARPPGRGGMGRGPSRKGGTRY